MEHLRFWNLFRPKEQRPPCRRLNRSEPVPMTAKRSQIGSKIVIASKPLLIVDFKDLLLFFYYLKNGVIHQEIKGKFCLTYQRSRSSDNSSLVIVLWSMAGADELLLSLIPRHDTPKVCADCINPISCKNSIFLHNKVGWISLKPIKTKQSTWFSSINVWALHNCVFASKISFVKIDPQKTSEDMILKSLNMKQH